MAAAAPKIRLYADIVPTLGAESILPEAASHYLCTVMRQGQGSKIVVFNGRDGEFEASLTRPHKKNAVIRIERKLRDFAAVPDIWLIFAPLKKDCTDFVLQKAVELGAAKILPVLTANTSADKVRLDRYQAQVIEAAEQSRRLDVPEVAAPQSLKQLLAGWNPERCLYLMDETGRGTPAAELFAANSAQTAAILIGPEGGFAPEEITALYALPFVQGVSLGSRILRAETAAAAALAVWQALAGDWKNKETGR